MATYVLEIIIDAPDEGAADQAYEEVIQRIADARDSGEFGDCDVSCGDLEQVQEFSIQ